jgi:hypothetical protein
MASGNSVVVEHSTTEYEIEGSNPGENDKGKKLIIHRICLYTYTDTVMLIGYHYNKVMKANLYPRKCGILVPSQFTNLTFCQKVHIFYEWQQTKKRQEPV